MVRSIRARLQLWYALVLVAVVAGFAGLLYYRVQAARWDEVNARLEASALYLDAQLRRFPPPELDRSLPPPRPGRGGPERPPNPPRPPLERLLAELEPPQAPGRNAGQEYFAVWRGDGSLLKSLNLPGEIDPASLTDLPGYQQVRLT